MDLFNELRYELKKRGLHEQYLTNNSFYVDVPVRYNNNFNYFTRITILKDKYCIKLSFRVNNKYGESDFLKISSNEQKNRFYELANKYNYTYNFVKVTISDILGLYIQPEFIIVVPTIGKIEIDSESVMILLGSALNSIEQSLPDFINCANN